VRLLTARLSAKRRSPLAGFVVLLLGLLLTGGAYAALSPATAASSSSSQSDVAKGRQLFLVGCASCHGQNGEGIVTQRNTEYGPPLIGVGAAAVDFQVGTGRMPAMQTGSQVPRKTPSYTEAEIEALAAYVASLAPGPAVPGQESYDVSKATDEQIVRGGELFRTNCTACHNFAGRGGALPNGKYAPSLMGVSEKHIYEAMLTGPQNMPVFNDLTLTPEDKRDIISSLLFLQQNESPGGFSLGSLGPVSEGLFIWIFGIGGLIAITVWITAKSN